MQVAEVAGIKWQDIALNLGFKSHHLNEFAHREQNSLKKRLFHLLVAWKYKEYRPTVGVLISACRKAGIGGEVERVIQKTETEEGCTENDVSI